MSRPSAPSPAPENVSRADPSRSQIRALIETHDWSASPLGPPANWPQSLRTTVGLMLPTMAEIVLFWGPEFTALYNDAYAPTIGDKHPRALGRPARENWAELWDDLEPLLRSVRETGETVFAKDRPFRIERHGYPETVYFDISYSPVPDETGAVAGVLCIVSETTKRVETEHRVRESEARFHAMADSIDQMIWSTLPDGHHDYYNQRWYDYTGAPEGSTDGEAWNGMFHPDDQDRAWAVWRRCLETGEPYHIEYRLRHRSGDYRWVLGRAQPVRDESGAITRWYGTCTDIHDLKTAETALRESEEYNRRILSSSNDCIKVLSLDARLEEMSPGGRVVMEIDDFEAIRGTYWPDHWPEDERPKALQAVEDARAGHIGRFQGFCPTGKGTMKRWDVIVSPITDDRGAPEKLLSISRDISEQFHAAGALRDSEHQFRALSAEQAAILAQLAEGVIVTDAEGRITFVNDAAARIHGVKQLDVAPDDYSATYHLFTEDGQPYPPDQLPLARAVATGEAVIDARWRIRTPEGREVVALGNACPVVADDGTRIGTVLTLRDETARAEAEAALRELNHSLESRVAGAIAEREQAQEALRQSQKMEAVGQLTGGIAHDFNNLLTVITGNVDAARRHLGETAEARVQRALGNALIGAERAATLTQRLLAFSRRQPLNPRPIDVNRLVSGMSELLYRTLGETVEVETVLAAGLWQIEADPPQLENAIINLAVNARDAMIDGGKLTIETSNMHLDRDYADQNPGILAGQYVAICVSDTGAGMDADTLVRAFEPFFTTKDVGKGTGLGLSMVYGFVKQSGGHLKIYSEEGQGTTVRIYLPRQLGAETEAEPQAEAPVPEGTREETILVCEDDDDVRAYTVDVLRELGYRVLEAHDGESAIRLLERQEGKVDLLFTDVVLPGGMTGAVVAKEARALRPDLKVLFTTGYARNAIVHHGRLDPGVELITKPFAYADLAARIRDLLDRS